MESLFVGIQDVCSGSEFTWEGTDANTNSEHLCSFPLALKMNAHAQKHISSIPFSDF